MQGWSKRKQTPSYVEINFTVPAPLLQHMHDQHMHDQHKGKKKAGLECNNYKANSRTLNVNPRAQTSTSLNIPFCESWLRRSCRLQGSSKVMTTLLSPYITRHFDAMAHRWMRRPQSRKLKCYTRNPLLGQHQISHNKSIDRKNQWWELDGRVQCRCAMVFECCCWQCGFGSDWMDGQCQATVYIYAIQWL